MLSSFKCSVAFTYSKDGFLLYRYLDGSLVKLNLITNDTETIRGITVSSTDKIFLLRSDIVIIQSGSNVALLTDNRVRYVFDDMPGNYTFDLLADNLVLVSSTLEVCIINILDGSKQVLDKSVKEKVSYSYHDSSILCLSREVLEEDRLLLSEGKRMFCYSLNLYEVSNVDFTQKLKKLQVAKKFTDMKISRNLV